MSEVESGAPLSTAEQQRVLKLVMAAGQMLLENGAEVFRVQETMQIMARSLGLRDFNVYVLTNGIFASVGGDALAQIRNVPSQDIHLGRVAGVNDISRRVAAGKLDLAGAEAELERVRAIPYPSRLTHLLACAMGSACYAVLFGGSLLDGAAGLAVGLILQLFLLMAGRTRLNKIITRLAGSALLAITAMCISLIFPVLHMDKIIIGALMTMTPGIALTTSIRDFVNADYLSGTIRMIDALLIAGTLACGVGLALGIAQKGLGVTL